MISSIWQQPMVLFKLLSQLPHCILFSGFKEDKGYLAMPGLEGIGKTLIIIGIVIVVLGLLLAFGGRIPFLGKLPGDILIRKDGFSFYFPIVTLLLLSAIVTLIINLIARFIGR